MRKETKTNSWKNNTQTNRFSKYYRIVLWCHEVFVAWIFILFWTLCDSAHPSLFCFLVEMCSCVSFYFTYQSAHISLSFSRTFHSRTLSLCMCQLQTKSLLCTREHISSQMRSGEKSARETDREKERKRERERVNEWTNELEQLK